VPGPLSGKSIIKDVRGVMGSVQKSGLAAD